MSPPLLRRRHLVGTSLAASMLSSAARALPALPASPVVLNTIDIGGDLALVQKVVENYAREKPNLVSRVTFSKAPMPELPAKLKAQQAAGRVDIDLVMCGYDGVTAGVEQNLWVPLLPDFAAGLPDLTAIQLPGANVIQQMTKGQALVYAYSPYGSLIEYMPDKVKQVPRSAAELLEWCRQNPGRFMYSRPANSGPARSFLTGLPYMLGDATPTDPAKGWDKTWGFLKELGQYVEYYPAATAATLKEFGEGSRDMIPSTTGWDINPRALGVVPKEARVAALEGFHWVSDAHCLCIPKGVPEAKVAVLLDLMSYVMQPRQQAYTFDDGYFYPGPAVKGVSVDLAPESSRKVIAEFGRPEYADLIASHPHEPPLSTAATVIAFRRWDEQIGAGKGH